MANGNGRGPGNQGAPTIEKKPKPNLKVVDETKKPEAEEAPKDPNPVIRQVVVQVKLDESFHLEVVPNGMTRIETRAILEHAVNALTPKR